MEVTVIVLGDIARSPRMLNHVTCLLSHDFKVRLIGYKDSSLPDDLKDNKNLKVCLLNSKALGKFKVLSGKLFILYAFLRLLFESLQLGFYLLGGFRSKVVLVQNPPSMPVLFVVYLCSCITGSSVLVDWHNYAWSLLKIANKSRGIVALAYYYEWIFGYMADSGFCVSQNMQTDLKSLRISADVLYDRPIYRTCSDKDMRKEFKVNEKTFFLVSSTSWTIDEDFSIVFKALEVLSATDASIFLLITGKGPMREFYMREIERKNWRNIRVLSAWLEIEDYPAVLKQADLGICLHTSSSGLDLPMKVVDMQQAELPALAFRYKTIHEFVQDGVNGEIFTDYKDLADKISVICK